MSYGIEVRNIDDIIKIDDTNPQLVVVGYGEIGIDGTFGSNLDAITLFPISKVLISSIDDISPNFFMLERFDSTFFMTFEGINLYNLDVQLMEVSSAGINTRLAHHSYYILLAKLSDMVANNAPPPQPGYGLQLFDASQNMVFTSEADFFEFDTFHHKIKADFLNLSTVILPNNGNRNYVDVSMFTKTHYNVGAVERFSITLGRFTSNTHFVTEGISYNRNFSNNNSRTDPGYIAQDFFFGGSTRYA